MRVAHPRAADDGIMTASPLCVLRQTVAVQHSTRRAHAQRSSWRSNPPACVDTPVREIHVSATPLRCPRSLVRKALRRVPKLDCTEGIECLRNGEAFVCEASDLIGGPSSPLRKWDLGHLQKHLPKDMKWPVMHRGTGKIVMTHSNRYATQAELDAKNAAADLNSERFAPVQRLMMSMDDFVQATRAHQVQGGGSGDPPYFGTDLLWRNSMSDNGNIQNIGQRLKDELMGGANFAVLKKMMDAKQLPLMKQVHSPEYTSH